MVKRLAWLVVALVVLACGCQGNWLSARYDTVNSGFNPAEKTLGLAQIPGLKADINVDVGPLSSRWAVPVVSKGLVYLTSPTALKVYPDHPQPGCTPFDCATPSPVWTAALTGSAAGSPTVADGVVYVATTTQLYAFDAAGTGPGCSPAPVTCAPLWTAPYAAYASPTVRNGLVYLVGSSAVSAFDAQGISGCSGAPKVCTRLWGTSGVTGSLGPFSSASVTGESAFVIDSNGRLYAFDAVAGATCSGAPLTCPPRWTAQAGSPTAVSTSSGWAGPVVSGSRVLTYTTSGVVAEPARLSSFDVNGVEGCAGTPKVCTPQWTTTVPGFPRDTQLTVGDGSVYVITSLTNSGYPTDSIISAYAVDGTGCGGSPMSCPRQWHSTSTVQGLFSFPVIANGLLYQHSGAWDSPALTAFDTHPSSCPAAGCGPAATVPRAFSLTGMVRMSVVDGALYVIASDAPSGRLVVLR